MKWDSTTSFTAPFKLDQWHCIEVEVAKDSISIYLDEVKAHTRVGDVLPPNVEFLHIGFGLMASSNLGATDLYFDEFAMANNRIGCQPL